MEMNIFEEATRHKLRFDSLAGKLSVEQLWDLPLKEKKGIADNLDRIAIATNKQLQESSEQSFVDESAGASKELQLKMDILKRVIAVKKQEIKDKKEAANRATLKQTLLEEKARRQNENITKLSDDELEKQLKELE